MKETPGKGKKRELGRLRYLGSFQTAVIGAAAPLLAAAILTGGILAFRHGGGSGGWYTLALAIAFFLFLIFCLIKASPSIYGFMRIQKSGIRMILPFHRPFYLFYRDIRIAGAASTRLGQETLREKRATVWIYLSRVPIRPHVLRHITELPNGRDSVRFPYDEEVLDFLIGELPGEASSALRRELRREMKKI